MTGRKRLLGAAAVAVLGLAAWWIAVPPQPPQGAAGPVVAPDLSASATPAEAVAGEEAFNARCAACHGVNAAGTDKGPPLVHRLYVPGHHADVAFLLAARDGVRAHHWRFGDMPPVDGVTEAEVTNIVAYVRAVQRANGIE